MSSKHRNSQYTGHYPSSSSYTPTGQPGPATKAKSYGPGANSSTNSSTPNYDYNSSSMYAKTGK